VDIGMQGGWGGSDIITFGSFGVSQEAVAGTDSETAAPTSPTGRRVLKPGLAGFNGALISSDIADILINALVTNGRSRVVSAPRILVNDNATGTLSALVGQPYASLNVANTVSTTSFGGYVNAGTTIDVTPHISEADYLQLEYSVSLDSFTGTGQPGIPPPLQTNSLRSSVTIPDGSTIIVGGLSRTNYSKQVSAVPILGEIPILEYLFSSRTQDESETTAFVFIRPVILRDDQFEDLKYLSERDVKGAQLPADMPSSEPVVMQ
jgi:type II secretory pathway component GspD/PulD (secretin)